MDPVELSDGVVELRCPVAADVAAITEACQDPAVQEWTTIPSPYAREHAVGFVEGMVAEGWAEGRVLTWAVHEGGRLAGMIGFEMRPPHAAEIGFWLARHARGRGVIDRAVTLVLDHGFDPAGLDLEVVEWRAFAGNWPSWHVAWRHGFRFEGVHRLGAVQRGRRRDDWAGSLLRTDPRTPTAPWPGTEAFGLHPDLSTAPTSSAEPANAQP